MVARKVKRTTQAKAASTPTERKIGARRGPRLEWGIRLKLGARLAHQSPDTNDRLPRNQSPQAVLCTELVNRQELSQAVWAGTAHPLPQDGPPHSVVRVAAAP